MPARPTLSPALSLIAALDRNRAIGRDNALPWRLPADLARFKRLTLGKTVLMGRRTAESLGRALPGRRNLVLTRTGRVPFPGMEAVASLEQALAGLASGESDEQGSGASAEVMVIGGGEVYRLCLPLAQRLHLTHIATEIAGADTHFPEFAPEQWRVEWREAHRADPANPFDYEFVEYGRCADGPPPPPGSNGP